MTSSGPPWAGPSVVARSPSTCPTRSSWSGPRTATTATTRPTSPCGWPSPPAGRRARWPRLLARELRAQPGIASVDVAGPGFLNITLVRARSGGSPSRRSPRAPAYGRTDTLAGQKLNLEFVSANPTGPVHLGATRWAAVGDAIGRLLEASGADVTPRVLRQRRRRADRAVRPQPAGRRLGRPIPEDGYRATTSSHGARVVAASPGVLDLPDEEQSPIFARRASGDGGGHPGVTRGSVRTSTPTSPSAGCTSPVRWRRRSPGCASRGTCSSSTAQCGCGRRTSATTRTACW